jgi:glycosyltransferase involved in cell wall biosynthesis
VVHRADVLVTCSEYTRELLSRRFGLRRESIVVMPSASTDALPPQSYDGLPRPSGSRDPSTSTALEESSTSTALEGHPTDGKQDAYPTSGLPYVLLTGGDAPSKNASRAVRAFAEMCRTHPQLDHHLLLLGIPPKAHARFARLAARAGIAERVEMLPYVSTAELGRLYRGADAVFFPSLYEGFGIPALEATASGVPLVCSRRTSLPEIAGEAAVYVDPTSVADMAAGLGRVLCDAELRQRLIREGRRQCRKFRPEVLRQRAAEVWRRVLHGQEERKAA